MQQPPKPCDCLCLQLSTLIHLGFLGCPAVFFRTTEIRCDVARFARSDVLLRYRAHCSRADAHICACSGVCCVGCVGDGFQSTPAW